MKKQPNNGAMSVSDPTREQSQPAVIPERKEMVLQAIRDYQARHPHMNPTFRELCTLTGITSTSVMNFYLDKLEAEKSILRYHGVARGISVA